MKKILLIKCLLLCLFSFGSCTAQQSVHQVPQKKAVFIILDGISSDVLEKIATPFLDEISSIGGYTRAYVGGEAGTYSQTPTISAVGYNSLLTGTWVHKHNVWGNGIKNPNYNYWNLFRVVEMHNKSLKTAIFSTWLDNRTKLIGEGLKAAGNIQVDYSFDGFENDTINFPHDKGRTYFSKIDEHVSKEAERYIAKNGPDLSWVYLQFTDNMGHKFGDSPQFYEAIILADKQVGRVWKAIKEREKSFNEDWMIVITTDHGRSKNNGKDHGGQSERERATWIVTNHPKTNSYFKNNPGIVDIMPSMMRYLDLEIPEPLETEIDGTSFIGPISISNLSATKKDSRILLNWKSYGINENADIYIATTNNFKNGGEDNYIKVKTVNSKKEEEELDISKYASDFYKILIRTKTNSLNKWIVN